MTVSCENPSTLPDYDGCAYGVRDRTLTDVRLSTFCHWANSGKYGRRHKSSARKRKVPVKFAEVQVAMGGGAGIDVELPGGVRIQVRDATLWPVVGGWIREVAGC